MGKLLLGVLLAVLPGSMGETEGGMASRKQRSNPVITCDPANPVQGGTATIKYSGTLPVTLDLDWDPPGSPTTVTITSKDGAQIEIPSNASSLIITDPNGPADDLSVVVRPS